MDEEVDNVFDEPDRKYSPISVCRCLRDDSDESEKIEITGRKLRVFTTVARTENYLRERRIPELIRFLMTKVIVHAPNYPVAFLEKLLDDCMLFRAGHGAAPVIYEDCHIKAIVKSFDPGNRGWMTSGQIRRAYTTMGLYLENNLDDQIPTDIVFEMLKKAQENELFNLVSAGTIGMTNDDDDTNVLNSQSKSVMGVMF